MLIRHIAATVIGCAVLTSVSFAADAPARHRAGVNAREHRQAARIRNGSKNGEQVARGLVKLCSTIEMSPTQPNTK